MQTYIAYNPYLAQKSPFLLVLFVSQNIAHESHKQLKWIQGFVGWYT